MDKRAMIGIGTLIVFIAGVLTAAIAAGVILRTQNDLQNRALYVGGQARKGVSLNFNIQSVRLIQDSDSGDYVHFEVVAKSGISSGDVMLNTTLVDVVSDNYSAALRYGGLNNSTGYYVNKENRIIYDNVNTTVYTRLHTDLDGDFLEEHATLHNSTLLIINMTTYGELNFTINNVTYPPAEINLSQSMTKNSINFGDINITANTTIANTINNATFIINPPDRYLGVGIFMVEFLLRAHPEANDDAITEGDIVKLFFENSGNVFENEDLTLGFKKTHGYVNRMLIATPDVYDGTQMILFP